jgi:hypothetical protein
VKRFIKAKSRPLNQVSTARLLAQSGSFWFVGRGLLEGPKLSQQLKELGGNLEQTNSLGNSQHLQ